MAQVKLNLEMLIEFILLLQMTATVYSKISSLTYEGTMLRLNKMISIVLHTFTYDFLVVVLSLDINR